MNVHKASEHGASVGLLQGLEGVGRGALIQPSGLVWLAQEHGHAVVQGGTVGLAAVVRMAYASTVWPLGRGVGFHSPVAYQTWTHLRRAKWI